MKYEKLTVNGLSISYAIAHEQKEETIFFIHGNSSSARTWHYQFEGPQLAEYRLVAIELPGHGRSSHSAHPDVDYSPVETGRIMAEVLKQLAAERPYIIVGVSYGTNILAEMLPNDVSPVGLVLIGMCCVGEGYGLDKVFQPSDKPSVFFYNEEDRNVVDAGIQDYLENQKERRGIVEDYFETDRNFRPAIFKAAAEGKLSDEIKTLSALSLHVCSIFGAGERLLNVHYADDAGIRFWRGRPLLVKGAGHFVHLDAAEVFDNLLSQYAAEQFKAVRA